MPGTSRYATGQTKKVHAHFGKVRGRRQWKGAKTPTYDPELRELRLGSLVLKRFRQPAQNQELLPLAFEEQGWSTAIDDPLPRLAGKNPKKHLHDTIQNLNRSLKYPLIRFYGDGTGRRVCWEWRQ